MPTQRIDRRFGGCFFHPKRLRNRPEDERGVAHWGERYEEDPVLELLDEFGGEADSESRLPGATCSGEREEAHLHATQQNAELVELALSADERACLGRQVGIAEAPQRWESRLEIGSDDLVQPFRCLEVVEPMHAQLAHLVP